MARPVRRDQRFRGRAGGQRRDPGQVLPAHLAGGAACPATGPAGQPRQALEAQPDDLDVRAGWSDYMRAYADALQRCGTPAAPWYVVPGDRKWYRNWAVARILLETLRELGPRFPEADFDVAAERERLLTADPLS
ncbi:MAG TPA: hypothetical protein VGJ95_23775 [Pseudonocardiaceae bacterium]